VTVRLYYQDPYLQHFDATIIETRELDGRSAVVLDATVFYPTGGGQPHDTGTLNGVPVVDVAMVEDGSQVHILDDASSTRDSTSCPRRSFRGARPRQSAFTSARNSVRSTWIGRRCLQER
jgi:alanyl-tRNA synthetase